MERAELEQQRADVVKNRILTPVPSLRTDLRNARATDVDKTVCIDGNLITSRLPKDLDAFLPGDHGSLREHNLRIPGSRYADCAN